MAADLVLVRVTEQRDKGSWDEFLYCLCGWELRGTVMSLPFRKDENEEGPQMEVGG